jgi:hypothetical protein
VVAWHSKHPRRFYFVHITFHFLLFSLVEIQRLSSKGGLRVIRFRVELNNVTLAKVDYNFCEKKRLNLKGLKK